MLMLLIILLLSRVGENAMTTPPLLTVVSSTPSN
jgi:hypothetical protein